MKRGFVHVLLSSVFVLSLVLATASFAQAKTEWKMALGDAAGGTQWALGERFAKVVEDKTGGDITIALFPNGQLGSEQETIANCRLGTLDLSVAAINNITPFSPTVGLFTLPYLMLSIEDAVTLTQGPIGDELVQNTIKSAGVRILGWSYSGFRRLSNSKRPVTKTEDLKGLTIRVPKKPDHDRFVQGLGHQPDTNGLGRGVHRLAAGRVGRPGHPPDYPVCHEIL